MRGRWEHRLQWLISLAVTLAGCGLAALSVATAVSSHAQSAAEAVAPTSHDLAVAELRLAIRARPDLAAAWSDRAQWEADDGHLQAARAAALAALRLNPNNWQDWQILGQAAFEQGDLAQARTDFREAAQTDQGFAGHYQLANFALLLGDQPEFWRELKAALVVAPLSDAPFALRQALAFAAGPADPELVEIVPGTRPGIGAAAILNYLGRHYYTAAAKVLDRMHCDPANVYPCAAATYNFVNTVLPAAFDATSGLQASLLRSGTAAWKGAIARAWVPQTLVAGNDCADGGFQWPWRGGAYSWGGGGSVLISTANAGPLPGQNAAAIQFDGQEPDQTELFHQFVPVVPGATYRIRYQSRSAIATTPTGLALRVLAPGASVMLRLPAALGSSWSEQGAVINVPAQVALVSLAFAYQRPSGQIRLQAPVFISDVRMERVR